MIEACRTADDERLDWSHKLPAFEGELKFDMTVELFGKRLTRKVRVGYEYTLEYTPAGPGGKGSASAISARCVT